MSGGRIGGNPVSPGILTSGVMVEPALSTFATKESGYESDQCIATEMLLKKLIDSG